MYLWACSGTKRDWAPILSMTCATHAPFRSETPPHIDMQSTTSTKRATSLRAQGCGSGWRKEARLVGASSPRPRMAQGLGVQSRCLPYRIQSGRPKIRSMKAEREGLVHKSAVDFEASCCSPAAGPRSSPSAARSRTGLGCFRWLEIRGSRPSHGIPWHTSSWRLRPNSTILVRLEKAGTLDGRMDSTKNHRVVYFSVSTYATRYCIYLHVGCDKIKPPMQAPRRPVHAPCRFRWSEGVHLRHKHI